MEVAKHSWEVHAEPGENGASETEQDPMVLSTHLHHNPQCPLPAFCLWKTLMDE